MGNYDMPGHRTGLKFLICLTVTLLMISVLFIMPALAESLPYPEVPRISTGDLNKMIDDPGLVIIDVRIDSQWNSSDVKISGAVHESPGSANWAEKYPKDSVIVTY